MKKYYCITLLAFIVVILLQGYNISLQYKGYINNKTDKVNSTLKIAIDEEYAYIKTSSHKKMGNNEFITNKCQKKTFSRQSQRKKTSST